MSRVLILSFHNSRICGIVVYPFIQDKFDQGKFEKIGHRVQESLSLPKLGALRFPLTPLPPPPIPILEEVQVHATVQQPEPLFSPHACHNAKWCRGRSVQLTAAR